MFRLRALPNKRVQRTRLRSPQTRHPLGAAGVALVILAVSLSGCTRVVYRDYVFQVDGLVVESSGDPLGRVRVTLQIEGVAYQGIEPVTRAETYTNDLGQFGFGYLAHQPSQVYSLWFDKQGYESVAVEGASLAESPHHIVMKMVGS